MRWRPVLILAAALGPAWQTLPAAAAQTVVSLNFDDNTADHRIALRLLGERGLKGTFYVNTAWLGTSGFYLNRADLGAAAAAGHEIAGHSLLHIDLTSLSSAELRRHVCDDRAALVGWGFSPTSFAYPYARQNAVVQDVVRGCGYTNARTVGGLACAGCVKAEPIPPLNAFNIRTPGLVLRETTLQQLKKYVTDAEAAGGGWIPFVFHRICNGCRSDSVTEADLTGFLDWLKESEGRGVVVQTMAQSLGTAPPPPSPPPPTPPPPPPPPSSASSIMTLSPTSWPAGGSAFNLTVDGAGFAPGAVVRWNGLNRPGVLQGTTRLIVYIPPSDVAVGGTASVAVFATATGLTNSLPFTVVGATASAPSATNPLPRALALSPSSRAPGGAAFNLTVDGVGFADGAVVRWDGLTRPGVRQGTTRLIVYIPPSDVAVPRTASVAVFNPSPGGGLSNALPFIVAGSGTVQELRPAADPAFFYREHYAFPNPSRRGQTVTIRIRTGTVDRVEVRIYDLTGRLVHEGQTLAPSVIGNEVTYDYAWDVSGAGSGVYVYSVTAKKAGERDILRVGKVGVLK